VRPAQDVDARVVQGHLNRIRGLSKRARVYAVVGVACAVAIGTVAAVVVTSGGGGRASASSANTLKGRPPLDLDLGLRDDSEAVALRKAAGYYAHGQPGKAASIFSRYHSVEAQVGSALASWPDDTLDRLGRLAAARPHDSFVQLHLGFALFWVGQLKEAKSAWRAARGDAPDTFSALRADDALHPRYNRGLPTFVPSFNPPSSLSKLAPRQQLAALAHGRTLHLRLIYGVALQRLGHPLSAERVFAAAAASAPDDPDAQVAAAVGRFDKDHPERAFSRLGPLTQRFPHAATVRFHLGLLLLWLGQVKEGKRQLRLAETAQPGSPLAREAGLFLARLK
jgi:tetratricopeptide (TPR) repeat protein